MPLRWYQIEACRAAWEYPCSKAGNPVICLATGSGKSVIAAELCKEAIERYGGRVVVLAQD